MGKYIYGEQEQPVKPTEFTHWKVSYKSMYGGRNIVFIPADKDLDSELDKIEDDAGIIGIEKVIRHFATREGNRMTIRFDVSNPANLHNGDTDAQLSGMRLT